MTELEQLAKAWIKFQYEFRVDKENEENLWAAEKLWGLNEDDPETAWIVINKILSLDDSNTVLECLSAGPLEELLSNHGPDFIDRIEMEAKKNNKFAFLLGGVWKSSINDDIYKRVQAAWDRKGWDGIPSE